MSPRVDSSRNRRQRRDETAKTQAGPSHPPLKYQVDEDDVSDKPQRSCDLNDDDENFPFSQELRNAHLLRHYGI